LLALLIGVATAIISLARILPHLLYTYPAPTRGLFFGLILASIYVVWHRVHRNDITTYVLLVLGALGAYLFVGLIPVQTPDHLTFIFLSGFIAICAMILPGISGAFLLLILGKYSYILEALSSVIHQRKFDHNLVVVIVFILGCVCGLLAFSRVLNWLLTRYNAFTLAMLTGLMIGSLRKIWPFQQPTEEALYVRPIIEQFHWPFANEILLSIDKKTLFLQNHWPQQWNAQTSLALSLVVVGILIVFSLDYLAHKKDK
jgi:putative membrane protein